jgi:hypothetical protein
MIVKGVGGMMQDVVEAYCEVISWNDGTVTEEDHEEYQASLGTSRHQNGNRLNKRTKGMA